MAISNPRFYLSESIGNINMNWIHDKIKEDQELFELAKFCRKCFERAETVSSELSAQLVSDIFNQSSELLKLTSSQNNSDFYSDHRRVTQQLEDLKERILIWYPQVAALYLNHEKDSVINRELLEVRTQYEDNLKMLNHKREAFEKELQSYNERYSDVLKKLELSKQEDLFKDNADRFRNAATWWLVGIAISVTLLGVVLILFIFHFCFEANCFYFANDRQLEVTCSGCKDDLLHFEMAKAIIYRILTISFLSAIVTICVKNYNNNMHNYVVSNHKSNSLAAAFGLLGRSITDSGKDSIMNLAANAIFSHQPTGFNKKDPENIISNIVQKVTG
ncbi:MAG TPA: hypothetical protein VD884_02210 [Ohtaekwangia sp.]|nr:hypothetical protein [Ohtaekwangia sp.]